MVGKTNALPPAGIDTSDATATAADIALGKTAYVDGEKLVGTYINGSICTFDIEKVVSAPVVIDNSGLFPGRLLEKWKDSLLCYKLRAENTNGLARLRAVNFINLPTPIEIDVSWKVGGFPDAKIILDPGYRGAQAPTTLTATLSDNYIGSGVGFGLFVTEMYIYNPPAGYEGTVIS